MYVGQFGCKLDIATQFSTELSDDINILYAEYTNEDYSGSAYVLYEQKGKLFEVYGSHCSCNGLEDQFRPEETSVVALRYRGSYGGYVTYSTSKFNSILQELDIIDVGDPDQLAIYLVSQNDGIRNLAQQRLK